MSYDADLGELYPRAAGYMHETLDIAKPTDLPVEKAYGVGDRCEGRQGTWPHSLASLLARADEVTGVMMRKAADLPFGSQLSR